MNQWIAKQVLDAGVYGVVWPHVSAAAEARNAASACRYPRPAGAERFEPAGQRGDMAGMRGLPAILRDVPSIGGVIIGEGDLPQEFGVPRQHDHPSVVSAIDDILGICHAHGVACGRPHVSHDNGRTVLDQGFRWLMPAPIRSLAALEESRRRAGR